jgi:competence protein ComEA
MIKKLLLAVATMMATIGFAFAQVDVNKADQAALDSVKGIGPAKSKQILDERSKGGQFKDWADFEKRVKGIGAKNSAKLSEAGLQVNGQSKAGAEMAKPKEVVAKGAKLADVKPAVEAKKDAKPAVTVEAAKAKKDEVKK